MGLNPAKVTHSDSSISSAKLIQFQFALLSPKLIAFGSARPGHDV